MRRTLSLPLVVLLGTAAFASCDNPAGTDVVGPPAELIIVSGDDQQGTVGSELAEPLVVKVVDDEGNPIPDQQVTFVAVAGAGTMSPTTVESGADGSAEARWRLGTNSSEAQTVEARVLDSAGATLVLARFDAEGSADAPAAISRVDEAALSAPAGLSLADSVAVLVTDEYGNPVPSTAVVWTVRAGGGSVSPGTSSTGVDGVARAQWVLGASLEGPHRLEAAAGIGLSTTLEAGATEPLSAVLTVVSGNAQTARPGTTLPDPLVVRVALPDGRPVSGVTIQWSPTQGQVAPGTAVTDANGLASTRWTLGPLVSSGTVTASSGNLAPVTFTAASVSPVTVQIDYPYPERPYQDTLLIAVTARSSVEVRRVSASVDGRSTNLVFSENAWRGEIILTGLQRGLKQLIATAEDANGEVASVGVKFAYDQKPQLSVESPLDGAVSLNGQMRVVASCIDDDPGDCEVSLRFGSSQAVVASAMGRLDATVSVSQYDDKRVTFFIAARDSSAQVVEASHDVYVQTSPLWQPIDSAGSEVLDISSSHLLYLDSTAGGNPAIKNRSTGAITSIPATPGRVVFGYLSPRGAIYIRNRLDLLTFYDWNGTSSEAIGTAIQNARFPMDSPLIVNSPFAVWGQNRRDLRTGETVNVGGASHVATNGDAVRGGSDGIYRYRAGTTTRISPNPGAMPMTDGVNVVYVRNYTVSTAGARGDLVLISGAGETVLAESTGAVRGVNYQLANGWVAFTRRGGGDVLQVWVRNPSGVETQVRSFGSNATIAALSGSGRVVIDSNGRRMYSDPPYSSQPVDFGPATVRDNLFDPVRPGPVFFLGEELIHLLGRSAFRIQ